MKNLRFGMVGTGFWSRFQLAGWYELPGVECVALANRTVPRARELAASMQLDIPVYQDLETLLRREQVDFIDIVTSPESHADLIDLAARRGIPVVCQKPLAASFEQAVASVEACRVAGVPLYVNENWRWQTPIRKLKQLLESGVAGRPYRARIRMVSAWPVFDNQPFLREIEQFLLVDIGSHILDVARFLFGEPCSLYCCTRKVQSGIRGEDVATVVLRFADDVIVVCEMGYPGTPLEVDHFPQTFAFVEGDAGSIELCPDYYLRVTTRSGTNCVHAPPPRFDWADPAYDIVHSSIVPCQQNLLAGLRGELVPETTGEDNLRTLALVFGAYRSASENKVIPL